MNALGHHCFLLTFRLNTVYVKHSAIQALKHDFLEVCYRFVNPLYPLCSDTWFPTALEAGTQCEVRARKCGAVYRFGFVLLFCHERLSGGCLGEQ